VTGNTINHTKFNGITIDNDDTGLTRATVTGNFVDAAPADNGVGISKRQVIEAPEGSEGAITPRAP
jgi:hypothetical protein